MKTLRLQRDPDGFFLWHPDYAPWIVGRRSLEANPNDRAFFDPNTGEIVWSSRDGMKDYEMDELVEMPQFDSERRLRTGCSSAGSRSNGFERRLRLSLQLAPDFVLDGLWQGFGVPTLRYVDRHTLRVQHVAMIVLRGLPFGHRSGPGDELVADHLLGQLLRRAAVRRDDPAALLSPRLFPPGHHSLQSSGPYARCHCGRTRRPAFLAAYGVRKCSGSRRLCNSR